MFKTWLALGQFLIQDFLGIRDIISIQDTLQQLEAFADVGTR
jgi:hypothetical protein